MAKVRQYRLKELTGDKKFGGQAKLIIDEIYGKPAVSVEGVAKAIAGRLETRQTPERVVGFYFSTWKKAGILQEIDAAEEAEPTDEEAEEEDEGEEEQAPSNGHPIEIEPEKIQVTAGIKVSDAVFMIVKTYPSTPEEVVQHLEDGGYRHPETARKVKVDSVNGALQNLIRRGSVVKREDGKYAKA